MAKQNVDIIRFCFDAISPFSWFALEILLRYEKLWNVSVELFPVHAPGIMKGSGNQPPATNKFKGQYLKFDAMRSGQWCGVPFRGMAKNFMDPEDPMVSVLAQRVILAACNKYGGRSTKAKQLTRSFQNTFMHRFSGRVVKESPELHIQICRQSGLGQEECIELLKMANTQQVKDKLRENTNWALQRGTFGFPTMYVAQYGVQQYFFGCDRIEHMAIFLQKPWMGPQPMPYHRSRL
eukprot:TRINITY_DN7470_c0_g3_i1.p2 TRINITY_DN7470_c0_g3~~TRINITY_DN7470_c0_g3_i1.p2  ORF type:complete len:236 (+),score=20.51 TRINITY_DN7470_c0_g3_i1:167-874(+)